MKNKHNNLIIGNYWVIGLLVIICIHLYLLKKLIFFPYQELFTYPYFVNQGLVPYSQILDQHFPGLLFFPINFSTLGMNNEVVARYWAMGVVAAVQILIFLNAKRIFNSDKRAILANALFLIWQPYFEGWVLWIDSFLAIFLLLALFFFLKSQEEEKSQDLFLTGFFLGMGIVFKQVVIPFSVILVLILFLNKKIRKKYPWFLLGLILLPSFMIIYILKLGVFKDFWYWTVIYNLTVFSKYGKKFPTNPELIRVLAVYGMVIFSWFGKNKKKAAVILLFLFGSLASVYARFDFIHFQPSLPFVIIGTIFALENLWKVGKLRFIIGLYAGVLIIFPFKFYKGHIGDKVFFFDVETKAIAQKIKDETAPGERIFIFGSTPHLYQMSGTLPADDIYIQQYSWFMLDSEEIILDSIKKEKPRLVVADRSVHVDGKYIVDYAGKINKFLLENYETKSSINSTEFLYKK